MRKGKLVLALALVLMLIFQTVAFAASAPTSIVVIGDKAFSLTYANDSAHRAEILAAIIASGNKIYVKSPSGAWYDNANGGIVPAATIPAFTMGTTSYAAGDVQVSPTPVATATPVPTATAVPTPTPNTSAPKVVSVEAVDAQHIVITFDKPMGAGAENVANYSIYPVAVGSMKAFAASVDVDTVGASAKRLEDSKKVQITISDTTGVSGFILNGLTNSAYILYVNQNVAPKVADSTGLEVSKNTNVQFNGTTTPDTTAPVVVSTGYASATKQLTVDFSEKVMLPDVNALTKVKLISGNTTITLKANADTVSTMGLTNQLVFTIVDAENAQLAANLTAPITINIASGAVKDANNNSNASSTTTARTIINPAVIASGSYYDELTNKLYVKFTKTMDVASVLDTTLVSIANNNTTCTAPALSLSSTSNSDTIVFTVGAPANVETYRANSEKYTVTVDADAIKDMEGNALGADNTVALAYVKDTTVPTITSVKYSTKDSKFTITFSEGTNKPGVATVVDNFAVKRLADADTFENIGTNALGNGFVGEYDTGATKSKWASASSLEIILTNATVLAEMKDQPTVDKYFIVNSGHGITDTNTNALADMDTTKKALKITFVDDEVPTVAVANHSTRLIKLTFTKNMNASTITPSVFTVAQKTNTNIVKAVASVITTSDAKVYYLDLGTVAANQLTEEYVYNVKYTGALKDYYNVAVAADNADITADTESADPSVSSTLFVDNGTIGVNAGDKIVVTYNEPVIVKTTDALFKANNTKLGNGATITAGQYANQIVITLGGSNITFKLGASGDNLNIVDGDVEDYSANSAAYAAKIAFPAGSGAPEQDGNIVFADVNADGVLSKGDTLTIPFDATIDGSQTVQNFSFNPAFTGGAGTTYTAAVSGKNIVITFTDVAGVDKKPTAGIQVSITAAGSNIKSLWGLEMTSDVTNVTVTSDVTVKPYITSAVLDRANSKLYVTFSEAISIKGTINAAAFASMFALDGGLLNSATVSARMYNVADQTPAEDITNKTVEFTLGAGYAFDEGITTINTVIGGAPSNNAIVDFDGNGLKRINSSGVVVTAK